MTPEAEQARKVARAEFVTRLFIVSLTVLLLVAVVTIVVLLGKIRTTQVDRGAKADKSYQVLHIVKDCVQPSGKCAQRNATALVKTIDHIGRDSRTAAALAAACAVRVSDPRDPDLILGCMRSLLHTAGHH